ncbi:MAG: DEAD/DEAH box helicase [Desulforhopalus sp.]
MSFKEFQFHPQVDAGIKACGYISPTPIQKEAIPPILAGRDILGLAQTGTGKTAAFVLPILQRLVDGPRKQLRALIVAPTRELAEQIHENISRMAKMTGLKSTVIYGGVGKQPQIDAISNGAEIVVACPGRLLDLVGIRAITLRTVEVLVLDEADHMLDKGFLPDIRRIVKQLPPKRHTLVFSATMPKEIRHLTDKILENPVTVQINHHLPAPTVSHFLYKVAKKEKTPLLMRIIATQQMASTLIFTRTKYKTKNLALTLQKAGHSATSLQGNLSQRKRQEAMDGFRDGTFKIMVATDIAARGIDVEGITHVINYDIPDTTETYTHRTGRTGRAERSGDALTFASGEDMKMVTLIERCLDQKFLRRTLPVLTDNKETEYAEKTSNKCPGKRVEKQSLRRRDKSRRNKASAFDFGVGKIARHR